MPFAWVWELFATLDYPGRVYATTKIKIGPPGASVFATAALASLRYDADVNVKDPISYYDAGAYIESYSTAGGTHDMASPVMLADNVVDITFALRLVINASHAGRANANGSFLVLSSD